MSVSSTYLIIRLVSTEPWDVAQPVECLLDQHVRPWVQSLALHALDMMENACKPAQH